MVDAHIWGKQSPPARKLMPYGADWLLLTPITRPPTFSSVLPALLSNSLPSTVTSLPPHTSSVLCWFLAAWCSQSGSHRKRAQVRGEFLPGESQGWGSLVGCCLWGHTVRHDWSDLAAAAEIPKPLNPSSAIYQQCDPEKSHKHNRSVSSSLIWGQ